MKARITHQKAPWPEGALVGTVVAFEAGVAPAWAAGKFVPAEEGDEPTLVVPATAPVAAAASPLSEADRVREEADLHIKTLRSQFEEYADDMQAKLASVTSENQAMQETTAQATAKIAELEAQAASLSNRVTELQAELDRAKAEPAAAGAKKK